MQKMHAKTGGVNAPFSRIFKINALSVFSIGLSVFLLLIMEPVMGAGIDPGMALTPFQSNIFDLTKLQPTTF